MAYGEFAIKVGEEVGVVRRHSRDGTVLSSKFGIVTKINGHGHIFVQSGDTEHRFTKTGDAYKDNWGPSLIHAAQLRAQLAAEERRKEQVRVARAMEQTLKEGYSYSGRFFVSQERIDKLKEVLAEMEKLVDA
jgi:hypothetical protein